MKVPGVGDYRLPSEFGYYENAKKWLIFLSFEPNFYNNMYKMIYSLSRYSN